MKELFNDGWSFKKILPDGSESDWKSVDIPHDWQIYDVSNLYESAEGWYCKEFIYDNSEDERIFLRFDGVYMDTSIWINDEKAFEWKYGYSTFEFEITPFIHKGTNSIKVRTVYMSPNSRWYSGAGIYRNVWIIKKPRACLVSDGTYIHTEFSKDGKWTLNVSSETDVPKEYLDNYYTAYSLYDKYGNEALGEFNAQSVIVNDVTVWDLDNPYLYTLKVKLYVNNILTDSEDIRFGFRTIDYRPNEGFFLNERHIKLRGVCMHHDLGCLGAAFNKAALKRQFDILKSMGVNAVRTSHNMPAPELMELAAEEGMLIDSEAFDMWEMSKTTYDYARFFDDWYKKDVRSWIRRDRNYPCVIMWSIGNEIYDTHAGERGQELTRMLMDEVYLHDSMHNAPVTIGSNYMPWENAQKCADIIKLAGYNYAEKYYDEHHARYPDWVIYGSETSSVVQSRGIYHFPADIQILSDDDLQCSSLLNSTTSWGAVSHERCISDDRDASFSAGMFIWSGFDYIGEPTPYHTRNSYFGQIDTAGFAKDSYYVYKSEWTDYKKEPMVHLFPYWDFNEGQLIDVMVCSNAPKVELFLNDMSLGTKDIDHANGKELVARWKVPYEKGTIKAFAYDESGSVIAKDSHISFNDAENIILTPDKTVMRADGEDLIFVTVSASDCNGNPVENANNRMEVLVSGAGRLLGLDNGDSTDTDQYKGTSKRLFSGKLLIVIAAKTEPGEIYLKVMSPGLKSAEMTFVSEKAEVRCGISANEHITPDGTVNDEIPVRKLEISSDINAFTADMAETDAYVRIYPENATYSDVVFSATDDNGVKSNIADVKQDGRKAHITALGDGTFRLRCTCANKTDHADIISEKEYTVSGLGNRCLNPYEFISGSLYTESKGDITCGNEKGVATTRDNKSIIFYDNIDFGDWGSDTITIPIFELENMPLEFEIWEGMPYEDGSTKILDAVYNKPSIWNTYQEETFVLNKPLKGITGVGFVFTRKAHIKGFSFKRENGAFKLNYPALCKKIYGDTFTVNEDAVCGIGNNVTFVYENMDFEEGTGRIVICARTKLPNNTVHIRFRKGDENINKIIEFGFSEDYIEREYELTGISGIYDEVLFVFLPGSDFDFKWFRFEK